MTKKADHPKELVDALEEVRLFEQLLENAKAQSIDERHPDETTARLKKRAKR